MQVCMMRLIINGRLRVTLSPLMNKMPIVGAAQFSLVQMPEFRSAPIMAMLPFVQNVSVGWQCVARIAMQAGIAKLPGQGRLRHGSEQAVDMSGVGLHT